MKNNSFNQDNNIEYIQQKYGTALKIIFCRCALLVKQATNTS